MIHDLPLRKLLYDRFAPELIDRLNHVTTIWDWVMSSNAWYDEMIQLRKDNRYVDAREFIEGFVARYRYALLVEMATAAHNSAVVIQRSQQ